MTFGQAYPRLLEGLAIRRHAWPRGMSVRLSDIGGKNLVMMRPDGNRHVWCPDVADLFNNETYVLRDDWEIIRWLYQ